MFNLSHKLVSLDLIDNLNIWVILMHWHPIWQMMNLVVQIWWLMIGFIIIIGALIIVFGVVD